MLSGDVGYNTPSTMTIDPRKLGGPPVLYSPVPSPPTMRGIAEPPPRPNPPPGPGAARPVAPEPSMKPRAPQASDSCFTFALVICLSGLYRRPVRSPERKGVV